MKIVKLNFLIEREEFYKVGDKVLIEYWYNGIITEVEILEHSGRKYLISHNTPNSEIFNAPNELINAIDIIDFSKR